MPGPCTETGGAGAPNIRLVSSRMPHQLSKGLLATLLRALTDTYWPPAVMHRYAIKGRAQRRCVWRGSEHARSGGSSHLHAAQSRPLTARSSVEDGCTRLTKM
jgi:hypothetical protein